MDGRRLRLDLFAFSLGALSLLTLGFFVARNGAAVIMCSLCFAGLVAARLVGFSNRALVPLAGGLVAILFILWVGDPLPLTSHQVSAFAHASAAAYSSDGRSRSGFGAAPTGRCGRSARSASSSGSRFSGSWAST